MSRSLRDTETPLELPTASRALRVLGRVARLRCPHCGGGAVLTWKGAVRARCSRCNLRFQRSDNNYFFGAVFFGLLLGEAIFAVSFGIMVIAMWPSVPWDTLTYGLPLGMIVVCALMVPISKVVWLAVDVLVRPVFPAELV